MEAICPFFADKVNIDIHIYITEESEPPLEEGCVYKPMKSSLCPLDSARGMSVLVGTGDNIWSGLYVISSTVGFVISLGLLNVFYINPFGVRKWWYEGLLFVACMVASVVIFGGLVVGLWHIWERQSYAKEISNHTNEKVEKTWQNGTEIPKEPDQENAAISTVTRYGSRPDFKEIFGWVSEKWGHVDVGVIVCGPPALQSSVAQEDNAIIPSSILTAIASICSFGLGKYIIKSPVRMS